MVMKIETIIMIKKFFMKMLKMKSQKWKGYNMVDIKYFDMEKKEFRVIIK